MNLLKKSFEIFGATILEILKILLIGMLLAIVSMAAKIIYLFILTSH